MSSTTSATATTTKADDVASSTLGGIIAHETGTGTGDNFCSSDLDVARCREYSKGLVKDNPGMVIGGVLGGIALIVLLIWGFIYYRKKSKKAGSAALAGGKGV